MLGAGGLVYGLVLAVIGTGAANGGDGAMIPLYIFGSPLFLPLLFFAPIVVWATITLILSRAQRAVFKKAFLALMTIHYLGAMFYLAIWGDWDQISQLWSRSPASVFVLIASYLVGQVAIWTLFAATQQIVGPERGERASQLD
jgi:hypothetical protein